MISLAHAGILILVALLYAANVEAQENQLLETLTRPRKVCEEGGLQFQPDKNNCGRFYECGLVRLARHYVSKMNWLFKRRCQIRDRFAGLPRGPIVQRGTAVLRLSGQGRLRE